MIQKILIALALLMVPCAQAANQEPVVIIHEKGHVTLACMNQCLFVRAGEEIHLIGWDLIDAARAEIKQKLAEQKPKTVLK